MKVDTADSQQTSAIGQLIGRALIGGEVIELIGDVGAGKTTLTKGIAIGLNIDDPIQSPTFTISNRYVSPRDLELVHYDFYRLQDAGLMREELDEAIQDTRSIVVVEWGDIIADVLPSDRLTIRIIPTGEEARQLVITASGTASERVVGVIA